MLRVTLLGSAATVASRENDCIYMLIQSPSGDYMIDCGGSPAHKLARLGAPLGRLRGVLLTHDHADHLYGFPLLVQTLMLCQPAGLWSGSLAVWGLPETLRTAQALLELFQLAERIPIDYHRLPTQHGYLALEAADLRLSTSPVHHSRPNVAVRIEAPGGRVLVYSSDTEPCAAVRQLAQGADILLHEAAVDQPLAGHSTPAQAGEVASAAGAGRLVLVHYDPAADGRALVDQAARTFNGPVELGQDWMAFEL